MARGHPARPPGRWEHGKEGKNVARFSRSKGKRDERDAASAARAAGGDARRIMEFDGRATGWDVAADISGIKLYLQCKARKNISWVGDIVDSILKQPDDGLYVWRLKANRKQPVIVVLEDDFWTLVRLAAKGRSRE